MRSVHPVTTATPSVPKTATNVSVISVGQLHVMIGQECVTVNQELQDVCVIAVRMVTLGSVAVWAVGGVCVHLQLFTHPVTHSLRRVSAARGPEDATARAAYPASGTTITLAARSVAVPRGTVTSTLESVYLRCLRSASAALTVMSVSGT